MHLFDPNLSIRDNYLKAYDVEFAAWDFAGHEHREEFRDSGRSPQRTAWLQAERMGMLKEALIDGELLALGIANDDPAIEIRRIPENLFLSMDLRIDRENSSISGMGREFVNVRICRLDGGEQFHSELPKTTGRPSHLSVIEAAWTALKAEMPEFLEWDKTTQNREIQEMAVKLFPAKFPGKSRIGESTIRRHRRQHPELFA